MYKEECSEVLPYRHGMTLAFKNSQQLWLPAGDQFSQTSGTDGGGPLGET